MPSASNTTVVNAKLPASNGKEKDTKMDLLEPFKQVVTLIEHKIRNMEKRKGKLDGYKQEQEEGKELNSDQLTAVAKYGEVMQSLEFALDLSKQVTQIQMETSRMIKKQQKKDYAERVSTDAERSKLLCQFAKWINLYKNVSKIRDDFVNGTNGATTLTEDEVAALNEIPSVSIILSLEVGNDDAEFRKATEYLNFLVDGKSSTISNTSVTYKHMKGVLISMIDCGYVYNPNSINGSPNENGSNDNDEATKTEKETKKAGVVESGDGTAGGIPVSSKSPWKIPPVYKHKVQVFSENETQTQEPYPNLQAQKEEYDRKAKEKKTFKHRSVQVSSEPKKTQQEHSQYEETERQEPDARNVNVRPLYMDQTMLVSNSPTFVPYNPNLAPMYPMNSTCTRALPMPMSYLYPSPYTVTPVTAPNRPPSTIPSTLIYTSGTLTNTIAHPPGLPLPAYQPTYGHEFMNPNACQRNHPQGNFSQVWDPPSTNGPTEIDLRNYPENDQSDDGEDLEDESN